MEKNKVIEVENLKIGIKLDEGMLTPVRGVNFSINEQESVGLVGESGCGKSLTCKALLGINSKNCITTGEIRYNDQGIVKNLVGMKASGNEIRDIRGKCISMIFQEPMTAFSSLFTIGNQLSEAVYLHITKDKKQAKELVIETMRKVGIANPEKRYKQYPHEFSGGMLQRAMIAMALICKPRLLIADEPTTALDVTIQAQILDLMKQLQKDYGMGILYITHDLGTVARMCDKVMVMYLGKIVEYAPVAEIFSNPQHPYTKGLIGSVHKIGGGKERLFSIGGVVPVAMNLEEHCGFYDRCSVKECKKCMAGDPELVEVSKDHFVACHMYDREK